MVETVWTELPTITESSNGPLTLKLGTEIFDAETRARTHLFAAIAGTETALRET